MPKRNVDPCHFIRSIRPKALLPLVLAIEYSDHRRIGRLFVMRRTLGVQTIMPARSPDDPAIEKLRRADIIEMDVGLKDFSLGTTNAQSCPVWVSLSAVALVVLIFVGDWVTPATVVVGLAYEAPVVFAGLKGTSRLTIQVTLLAVIGLTLGWFMDLSADSYHFSADRIENRLLSVLSLLIASCLTLRAQRINPTLPS